MSVGAPPPHSLLNALCLIFMLFREDLNWGYTTYDNFGAAMLSVFQVTTLEGWSEQMYQVTVIDQTNLCLDSSRQDNNLDKPT